MEDEGNQAELGEHESSLAGEGEKDALGTAPAEEKDSPVPRRHLQNLLDMRLVGLPLANGEDPDEYIRSLREGWD